MAQDFKKEVKKRLVDMEWNTTKLAETVTEKTGLFCDTSYISKILSDVRNAPKVRAAICEILDIKEE